MTTIERIEATIEDEFTEMDMDNTNATADERMNFANIAIDRAFDCFGGNLINDGMESDGINDLRNQIENEWRESIEN